MIQGLQSERGLQKPCQGGAPAIKGTNEWISTHTNAFKDAHIQRVPCRILSLCPFSNPWWAMPLTFALPHSHQSPHTALSDYHLTSVQFDRAFVWLWVTLPNPVDGKMLLIPYAWLLSGMGFSRAQKWEAGLGIGMGKISWEIDTCEQEKVEQVYTGNVVWAWGTVLALAAAQGISKHRLSLEC